MRRHWLLALRRIQDHDPYYWWRNRRPNEEQVLVYPSKGGLYLGAFKEQREDANTSPISLSHFSYPNLTTGPGCAILGA